MTGSIGFTLPETSISLFHSFPISRNSHGSLLGRHQDAVEKLLEKVIDAVLRLEAEEQVGAGSYERSADRKAYRNGYRERTLTTRVGSLTIQIPKLREGTFTTELFGRYQRSEQALMTTLMEMVVQGVSTRKISQITEELCGTKFSHRRGNKLRIFPNTESIIRLMGALLLETHEKWITTRSHLRIETGQTATFCSTR